VGRVRDAGAQRSLQAMGLPLPWLEQPGRQR